MFKNTDFIGLVLEYYIDMKNPNLKGFNKILSLCINKI